MTVWTIKQLFPPFQLQDEAGGPNPVFVIYPTRCHPQSQAYCFELDLLLFLP